MAALPSLVPAYVTQQLVLREEVAVPGEFADYNLASLKEGECVAMLFKPTGVAVLVCGLGNGFFRVAAKPIPPQMRSQL